MYPSAVCSRGAEFARYADVSDDCNFHHLLSTPRPENEAGLGPEFSGLGAVFRPIIAPSSASFYYLRSDLNPGQPGDAPTAPGYSAGDGWTDRDNMAHSTITVTAGDGSSSGGGGGGH
jgi:hypothetical protein